MESSIYFNAVLAPPRNQQLPIHLTTRRLPSTTVPMASDSRPVAPDTPLYVSQWIEKDDTQDKDVPPPIFQLIANNKSRVWGIDALRNRATPAAALKEEIEGRCKEFDLEPTYYVAKDGSFTTVDAALILQRLTSGITQPSGTNSGILERLWCKFEEKKRYTASPVYGTSQDPSSHL